MVDSLLSGPKTLGAFLRRQRENTAPERVGITPGRRRRTQGLRREEVAQLSGISATWYTWIEQGRDIVVSAQTLASIADALQLPVAARRYLFALAQQNDPQQDLVPQVDRMAIDAVQQVIVPCYLLDLTWNMLAWNAAAATLFRGWLDRDAAPNMMHFLFLHPLARTLVADWETRAGRVVAELRADATHYQHDVTLNRFVEQMAEQSEAFRLFWARQQVVAREGGERVFRHQQGERHFHQQSWQLASNRTLKMILLMPVD